VSDRPTNIFLRGGTVLDDFFKEAVEILQALVFAIRKGHCAWYSVFLLEAHGEGNPVGSQDIKQTKQRKEYRARPPPIKTPFKQRCFFMPFHGSILS